MSSFYFDLHGVRILEQAIPKLFTRSATGPTHLKHAAPALQLRALGSVPHLLNDEVAARWLNRLFVIRFHNQYDFNGQA
ncbi:MAG: hypothetical protein A4E19_10730 [Nitrospira sp. SG-bin1]|nr:MAG: hypothetical protein A4E19_10730 [Nitrospira sp. SG-bin1]